MAELSFVPPRAYLQQGYLYFAESMLIAGVFFFLPGACLRQSYPWDITAELSFVALRAYLW